MDSEDFYFFDKIVVWMIQLEFNSCFIVQQIFVLEFVFWVESCCSGGVIVYEGNWGF